jgi:hypothetical protein
MIAFYLQQRLVVPMTSVSLEVLLWPQSSIIFCSGDFDILNGFYFPNQSYQIFLTIGQRFYFEYHNFFCRFCNGMSPSIS